MAYDRPTHPKMHITRGVRRMESEEAAIPDVQAAAEADGPIDDHHLAVIAQVRIWLRERYSQGKEVRHRHAALPQRVENRWMAVSRAHPVDQDPHRDAARRCARQGVHELEPATPWSKNVCRERHTACGALDRGEHRRVGLVAVHQDVDGAPVRQGLARHLPHELRQRVQLGGNPTRYRPRSGGFGPHPDGLRAILVGEAQTAPYPVRLAADAVDAEEEIEHRPDDGREPHEAHPPDRRAYIVLGEYDVR